MLEQYLRIFTDAEQINWAKLLFIAEFIYINNKYSATGETPFYIIDSYHLSIYYIAGDGSLEEKVPAVSKKIKQLHKYCQKIEAHLRRVIKAKIKYYNKIYKLKAYIKR